MSEDHPIPVTDLLAQGCCCGSGCLNCPYVPRHQAGGMELDQAWVAYAQANPTHTYEDYLKEKAG